VSFLQGELSPFAPAAEETTRTQVPWEDPALPRLAGFYRTLWEVLRRPGEFFARAKTGGWAEPLAFALTAATLGLLAAIYWSLLLGAAASGDDPGAPGLGMALALMVPAPGVALLHLIWGSLCLWGAVALLGVKNAFLPVWRLFCYAQAAMAAALLPVLGGPVAGVWMLYLVFRGVKQGFQMTGGRALGALLLSLLLQALGLALLLASLLGLLGLVWLRLLAA
jgi:hypothetical protein